MEPTRLPTNLCTCRHLLNVVLGYRLKASPLHVVTAHEGKWSISTFVIALTINILDIVASWADTKAPWVRR